MMKGKRGFAWLLTAALLLGLLPSTALADETIADSDGAVTWSDGTYILDGNAMIAGQITVSGNVTLVLQRGTLEAKQGIYVPVGASLIINGTDATLEATGVEWSAGIGGRSNFNQVGEGGRSP